MNQDQSELTLEESIKQVMQTLPPVIRAYLVQGKYTVVARGLMAKYALRIDQAGVLEREIMLLLMGIENPDEFIKVLTDEAQLGQQVINGIVRDVNSQIFVPLQEEERKNGMGNAPQPAVLPPSHFHLENKIPAGVSKRPALRDVLAAVTMTPNNRMLEDHEEPHIEFKQASMPPAPQANLPGAMPSVAVPEVRPSPILPKVEPHIPKAAPIQPRPIPAGARAPFVVVPKVESSASPKTVPSTPAEPPAPAKPYSVDPYREPIDH